MLKSFLIASVLIFATAVSAQTIKYSEVDHELLSDLLSRASSLSGLQKPDNIIIKLYSMSENEISSTVCPEDPASCRGLVALYDTDKHRILYRNTLDMRNFTDQSFIVHELVHYLQHNKLGDKLFESCKATVKAEQQAYMVQNAFLKYFGQWMRVGEMLRFMNCDNVDKNEPTVQFGGPAH